MTKKSFALILSLLLTFLMIREVLRFFTGDFVASVIPAWNTTISSTEWMLSIGAFFICVIALIATGLFKVILKFLIKLFGEF